MVSVHLMAKYCNADPAHYKNVTQIVPNSQIPDEDWHPVSRETTTPWDQYNTLKMWAEDGTEPIRKVRLERLVGEPVWEYVTEDDEK